MNHVERLNTNGSEELKTQLENNIIIF